MRCGIVFARFNASRSTPPPGKPGGPTVTAAKAPVGVFRLIYRVISWLSLAGLVLTLILILRPSAAPRIVPSPDDVQRAQSKVLDFQTSAQQGRADTLTMNESELNGWLQTNLALQRPADSASVSQTVPKSAESVLELTTKAMVADRGNQTVEQVRASVRDVKIELLGDSLRAYVAFELYGKDMSLELEGRLGVKDGYLRLEPTAGKLGSLPLLSGTLESAAQRLFDSPENRENFRLPPGIRDIKIQGSEIIVSSR